MKKQVGELYRGSAAMKATGWIGAIVLAAGALIWVPRGARAGKPGSHTPVDSTENLTTIVHDTDTSGAQLLLRSDDYNGSGQATYSAALDPNLISDLFGGAYFLRMYSQSTRTLYITPNDAINSSQPAGPTPGYYWENVELAASCYDQNLNQVLLENILTSSGNCLMILDFNSGGIEYKLAMGPQVPQKYLTQPVAPSTGLVTVTCNATSVVSGVTVCMNWTLTPNMSTGASNPPTVADLFYPGSRKQGLVFVGQYHETFRIDMTNP